METIMIRDPNSGGVRLDALGISGKDGGLITIALNVPSGKYKFSN